MAANGHGGALITWEDGRNALTDVFAQEVEAKATLRSEPNGAAVCVAAGYQAKPTIVSDGAGGALVVWEDFRTAPPHGDPEAFVDIYAQHLLNGGQPDPSWPINGRPVSTAPEGQGPLSAISDDRGGIIVVWRDNRELKGDVYAQRVTRHGELGQPGEALKLAAQDAIDRIHPPANLDLAPPSPNPARSSVTFEYALPQPSLSEMVKLLHVDQSTIG